jgi:hypothetical protein
MNRRAVARAIRVTRAISWIGTAFRAFAAAMFAGLFVWWLRATD